MKKISVDELVETVDSRYSLVTIISRRARQIIDGSEPLIKTNTIKPVAVAIEEYHEGKYEAIYDYDNYKKALEEKKAAEEIEVVEEANNEAIIEEETLEEK